MANADVAAAPPPEPPPKVAPPSPAPPHPELAPLAAFLSYLVPGLGQIAQGRVGKGLLFLVCIYTLFFYGQYLGSGSATVDGVDYEIASNVYLPDLADEINPLPRSLQKVAPRWVVNVCNRPQFAGQFWVGIAAWPAIYQYWKGEPRDPHLPPADSNLFGQYQRTPPEEAINAVSAASDKRIELGWVYTVIAGVLNIMVIYDALAGPAFASTRPKSEPPQPAPSAGEPTAGA
jgi:TM2 domain-containing membrane protein YozV